MPELPEVETVRRTLEDRIVGRVIDRVQLLRRDIVTGRSSSRDLLVRSRIVELRRKGKQLAIIADALGAPPRCDRRAMVIRLGMTGQLLALAPGESPRNLDHIHARWLLRARTGSPAGTLLFRDPRRFGGIFTYDSPAALGQEWSGLGPDALDPPRADHPTLDRLWRTKRPIKAALLDQRCIAGVGNIYADEALFRSRIHPMTPAESLEPAARARLLIAVRTTLRRAVAAGGSTIRDYRDASGGNGWFQISHQVYGRAGLPCPACGRLLESCRLAQRTTVYCPECQKA